MKSNKNYRAVIIGLVFLKNPLEKFIFNSQIWWYMYLTPVLGRQRQAELLSSDSLIYIEFQDSQGHSEKPCLKRVEVFKTNFEKNSAVKTFTILLKFNGTHSPALICFLNTNPHI